MAHILIVEDMPDALSGYELALQMAGHRVVSTTDPRQASLLFAENEPLDLVILDLAMPGMNGFEVAAEIRLFQDDARIVFLTAFDDPLSVGRAESSGAKAFWSKPITADALCANVAQVLRQ